MNHLDLIDDRCFTVVRDALTILTQANIDYVLAGGWAVYVHAPSIPSIDTDIFLTAPFPDRILKSFAGAGLQVGHGKEVEPLDMNDRLGFWAHGDEDLGIPLPGFRPIALLQGETMDATLRLPDSEITVRVPTPTALCCLKLCALANRDLAYRSFHDGRAGMLIGPQRVPLVHQLAQSYYLRKAGKDLFDVSVLLPIATPAAVLAMATRHGCQQAITSMPPSIDPAVQASAMALSNHADTPDPGQILQEAFPS